MEVEEAALQLAAVEHHRILVGAVVVVFGKHVGAVAWQPQSAKRHACLVHALLPRAHLRLPGAIAAPPEPRLARHAPHARAARRGHPPLPIAPARPVGCVPRTHHAPQQRQLDDQLVHHAPRKVHRRAVHAVALLPGGWPGGGGGRSVGRLVGWVGGCAGAGKGVLPSRRRSISSRCSQRQGGAAGGGGAGACGRVPPALPHELRSEKHGCPPLAAGV